MEYYDWNDNTIDLLRNLYRIFFGNLDFVFYRFKILDINIED